MNKELKEKAKLEKEVIKGLKAAVKSKTHSFSDKLKLISEITFNYKLQTPGYKLEL